MAVHFLEEEAETTEAMVPAMVETDESGQGGTEKIPETDDIFTQLILQANHYTNVDTRHSSPTLQSARCLLQVSS